MRAYLLKARPTAIRVVRENHANPVAIVKAGNLIVQGLGEFSVRDASLHWVADEQEEVTRGGRRVWRHLTLSEMLERGKKL